MMDRPRRLMQRVLLAPKHFLDWVYTDPGATRPRRPCDTFVAHDARSVGSTAARRRRSVEERTRVHRAAARTR